MPKSHCPGLWSNLGVGGSIVGGMRKEWLAALGVVSWVLGSLVLSILKEMEGEF